MRRLIAILTLAALGGWLLFSQDSIMIVRKKAAASAVTYDASASGKTNNTTTCAFDITVGSGTNRAIGIGVAWSVKGISGVAVTVGGTAAALVTGSDSAADGPAYRSAMYTLAAPASGVQSVSVTWTTNSYAMCGAVTVTGADQTTPMNNGTYAIAYSGAASLEITSTSGDMTLDTIATESGGTPTTPTQTGRWADNSSSQVGGGASTGPGTGTTTHAWDYSGRWTMSGANFKKTP